MIHTRLEDGTQVSFEWRYVQENAPYIEGPVTYCDLHIGEIVYGAAAITNINDRFIKEFGRKLTLKRALARTNLDKNERTTIWNAYLNRRKIKVHQHA